MGRQYNMPAVEASDKEGALLEESLSPGLRAVVVLRWLSGLGAGLEDASIEIPDKIQSKSRKNRDANLFSDMPLWAGEPINAGTHSLYSAQVSSRQTQALMTSI